MTSTVGSRVVDNLLRIPNKYFCRNFALLICIVFLTQSTRSDLGNSNSHNYTRSSAVVKRQTFRFPTAAEERREGFRSINADTVIIDPPQQPPLSSPPHRFFGKPSANSRLKVPSASSAAGTGFHFPDPVAGSHAGHSVSSYDDDDNSSLEADIKALDEILDAQMRQKKPSIQMSFHLLPQPNFSFLPDLSPLRQLFKWSADSVRSTTTCYACKVASGLFLTKTRLKTTMDDVKSQAIFACNFFQLTSSEVCTGLVERFAPTLYYIGASKTDLSPITFCAMVLQSSGCITKDPEIDWTVPMGALYNRLPSASTAVSNLFSFSPFHKENVLLRRSRSQRQVTYHEPEVPLGVPTTKILHLTDIHLDMDYQPGANTECSNELCCRAGDGLGKPGNQAGYYGDYRGCDLPLHSLENALQHISRFHPDIDLIYMTGDLVSHEIWKTNIERNVLAIQTSTALIRKYFPRTRLIPVLGNHETHPVNLYTTFVEPHPLGTDWVYEATAKAWEGWIPQESLHHFLRAGYYDVKAGRNFRVVVLNTNLCYTYNFWQIYDGRDPGGQLDWLVQVLTKSESIGEKVHILGHVPPNQNECWFVWSRNFYQIINRFSSTVKAQFYAHTHYDGFHLYYAQNDFSRPISPIWIGASLTPFTNLNPGYKIFEVDGARDYSSTWNVLDHETWIYNLTEANLRPHDEPNWFRLYRATEAYDLPNVLPESLDVLVHRMATDSKFFHKYYRNYHKAAEVVHKSDECDTVCKKRILCSIVTPYFTKIDNCLRIEAEIDGIVLPRS